MKKFSLFHLGLMVLLIALFSSCKHDDTYVGGLVSYVDIDDGQEYVTSGVSVYLMPEGAVDISDAMATTTTDDDGYYHFYPVPDGKYYIYAEFFDIWTLHTYRGKSPSFEAKRSSNIDEDVVMY